MVVCSIGKLTQETEVNEGSQAERRQVSELRFAPENFLGERKKLIFVTFYNTLLMCTEQNQKLR